MLNAASEVLLSATTSPQVSWPFFSTWRTSQVLLEEFRGPCSFNEYLRCNNVRRDTSG